MAGHTEVEVNPASTVAEQVQLDPPPPVARRNRGGWLWRLIPAAIALGMLAVALGTGSTASRDPLLLLLPVTMAISVIAAGASGVSGGADLDGDRRRYLSYLESVSDRLAGQAGAQREWLDLRYPAADRLWWAAGDFRRWDRRRTDSDFAVVRVGSGAVPAWTRAVGPEPEGVGDPVTADAREALLRDFDSLADAPITLGLAQAKTVGIRGPAEARRALARAMVCQLAVSHHPNDLGVCALTDGQTVSHWDWVKWLPHRRESATPDSGDSEMHVVVIVDGAEIPVTRRAGVTVVHLADGDQQRPVDITVRIGATTTGISLIDGSELELTPDALTPGGALAVARHLAGMPVAGSQEPSSWRHRMGLGDTDSIEPSALWAEDADSYLRVPLGSTVGGGPVELDIRESAEGGMGPHGLCVGATGSGKSELLRTVVLGMIARHPPQRLNLILIDFKGGATFLGLGELNHVSAVVTNLSEESHLVDRMADALRGEIDRRQRILRAAGNLSGISEYRRALAADSELPPLPALVLVVDEFSELLAQHPDFHEVFVAIGRLGRSLGIHLLLASQRLDEGRLRGLEAHLSYRICLKTLTAVESRIAIGVPDAYELPSRPGVAYLKVGAEQPVRFTASYVSTRTGSIEATFGPPVPQLFTARSVDRPARPARRDCAPTLLDEVVGALAGHGMPAHRVWLEPLSTSPALQDLLATVDAQEARLPLGVVDRTFEHRRDPLLVDLSGAQGNVAVIGAPQSGKSTALRTLVTALAATRNPRQVQVYCLDFGGGRLSALAELPHVGAVAGRGETELARRIVTELTELLARREAAARCAPGSDGQVFLVIDGWSVLRAEHPDLETAVNGLAGRGLSVGLHVVLAASRWADLRPGLRDQFGTRLELRLGDPADSEIDRIRARQVPPRRPGHGLCDEGLPMVIALPGDAVPRVGDGWRAPAIRLLPDRVCHRDLLARSETATAEVLIGLDERTMAPVALNWSVGHLVVLGEAGCGKTAALRLLGREIARTAPDAELVVIDPRGTLTDFGTDGGSRLPEVISGLEARIAAGSPAGTDTYLLVDDYELVSSELCAVAGLLPQARDIGLHVVIARHSGGAARALYDPVLGGLRELGAAGLQMSAGPDDATIVSSMRPGPLPPGRATLVTRTGGRQMIQLAWIEPA